MFKSALSNYFGFNKRQRNGLFVLLLISFLLLVIRIVYPYFIQPDDIVVLNLPLVERQLDSSVASSSKKYEPSGYDSKPSTNQLFVFDPNTVSFEQLLALGFNEKNAGVFLKFRNRGFVFKQKEDLKKVYGVSDYLYGKLEPYIKIEPKIKSKAIVTVTAQTVIDQATKAAARPAIKVELNSADSLALLTIPGIGPVFAKRIIKYRSILGGYVSVDQLKEVYGFTAETFDKTHSYFSVNADNIKKINLNTDDFKTINRHPYLGYERTKTIFNQRRIKPLTPADLESILNDPALYRKLLSYLVFD